MATGLKHEIVEVLMIATVYHALHVRGHWAFSICSGFFSVPVIKILSPEGTKDRKRFI